jgi:multiple sugar transport system substrate-binding protein
VNAARLRRSLVGVTIVAVLGTVAACGGGDDPGGDADSITVWIQEDLPDRVAATQKIVDDFEAESGVTVKLVSVAEDQFNQLLTSAAAAGELPDVIGGISLPQVRTMSSNELLDTDAAGDVMSALDESTFSERALELTREDSTQLAVPSESWAQLLFYRKDLFDDAGLPTPTTYDDITAAAEELDGPEMAGFVGATAPGDAFTEQTFEHVALGNNCQLVDDAGEVTFDSPECVTALDFYGNLIENYSVPGAQDVDTTRASYFAGKAAMFIWSTFVLDEMAGLREDALPNCPECKDDPAYLAKNTGVVTTIEGPDSAGPAVFGEITSWVVTADSATAPSTEFVEYMFGDGYVPWISIAPEGKVPVRLGTAEEPTTYSDQWSKLPVGIETKAPLSDFYPPEVLDALAAGPSELSRWALAQGQGDLLGALQGELPVATAVNEVTSGTDAQEAADAAAETVRSIQDSLP